MTGGLLVAAQVAVEAFRRVAVRERLGTNHEFDRMARELVAKLLPLLGAEAAPDIVTGEQSGALPVGSYVILCHEDGRPLPEMSPMKRGQVGWTGRHSTPAESPNASWRVLYRAPAPVPKVGDVVTTEAQLRALQVGAIVRAVGGMRVSYERLHNDQWHAAGDTSPKSPDVVLRCGGVRVLDLGEPASGAAS